MHLKSLNTDQKQLRIWTLSRSVWFSDAGLKWVKNLRVAKVFHCPTGYQKKLYLQNIKTTTIKICFKTLIRTMKEMHLI